MRVFRENNKNKFVAKENVFTFRKTVLNYVFLILVGIIFFYYLVNIIVI